MDNQSGSSQNNQAHSSNSHRDDEFALHNLDDHCLLEIFSYLGPRDTENLAKTSERMKNLSLYPMHKRIFAFHSDMVTRKTEQNVTELDAVLGEFGEHIKSWSLTIELKGGNFARGIEILRKVSRYCTNLKKLEVVYGCDFTAFVTACEGAAAVCLENVEYLICECCDNLNLDFIRVFRKLKHVNFYISGTSAKNLQILFRNNQDIESFCIDGREGFKGSWDCDRTFCSQFSLCEFGPKFDKLYLGASCDIAEMGPMQRLAATNLTKFKLGTACAVDLDIFLTEMAKAGNLKELELFSMEFNRTWFDVLQSFKQLELLVLRPETGQASDLSSVMWPPNLKYLSTNIGLNMAEFLSTIRQLKHLQRLRLSANSTVNIRELTVMLMDTFNERIRRPKLQLTVGMSRMAIIDFHQERVIYGISLSDYNDLQIVPADINNFIGIDFSVRNYACWQWNPKRAHYGDPPNKIRKLKAGSSRS